MKTTTKTTSTIIKTIDQQLKAILAKDIRKIDDANIRNAVFLQMIAA